MISIMQLASAPSATTPRNNNQISKRVARERVGFKSPSPEKTIPVLKIDLDRNNLNIFNLFVFRSVKLFNKATQSLEKLFTTLIRKGLINFSKKDASYYLAERFQKLLTHKSNTKIYDHLETNYDNDPILEKLRKFSKTKNHQLGTITRRGNDASKTSFEPRKGYQGIIEKVSQRPLKAGEQVHHIDHDHSNNRPFNLYLCADQDHHTAIHEQLRRIGTILIQKGLISFSRKEKIYQPSTVLNRILKLRKTTPPYMKAAELRDENRPAEIPLSRAIAKTLTFTQVPHESSHVRGRSV